MRMILLGTGTSHGVPVIACSCSVCHSSDSRDKRLRSSAYIFAKDTNIVIDTGPDFRVQALRAGIRHLDAIFLTHSHADHLNGLDDVRIFSHTNAVDPAKPDATETKGAGLPLYANETTLRDVKNRFDYIFTPVKEGGGKPKIRLEDVSKYGKWQPIQIGELSVYPVPLLHGSLKDLGYFIRESGAKKSIAYLTDCNKVPTESIEFLRNEAPIDHLVIDGLRRKSHSTHFSFLEALSVAEQVQARHTWLTHITHDCSHVQIQAYLDEHLGEFPHLNKIVENGGSVAPAYDGLEL